MSLCRVGSVNTRGKAAIDINRPYTTQRLKSGFLYILPGVIFYLCSEFFIGAQGIFVLPCLLLSHFLAVVLSK